jgi:hypothetical protein
MAKDEDKNCDWGRALERAWETTRRIQSPHVPVEPPSWIKKVDAKTADTPTPDMRTWTGKGVSHPLPDHTLDELYRELVQNGLSPTKAVEDLWDELLAGARVITSGESVGRLWEEGGKLCAASTDGLPLDPTRIATCEEVILDSSGKVARVSAQLAAEERDRNLLERLKGPSTPPVQRRPTPMPLVGAKLHPAPKKMPESKTWKSRGSQPVVIRAALRFSAPPPVQPLPTGEAPPLPASKAVDVRRLSLPERDKFLMETLVPFLKESNAPTWRKADDEAESRFGPIPKDMLARARGEAKFRGNMGRPRKDDK